MEPESYSSPARREAAAFLELDQALAGIVALASEVLASDYTSLVLLDKDGHLSETVGGLPGAPHLAYRIREQGVTRWIIQSRRAVIIDEIGEDGVMSPDLGEGVLRTANPAIVDAGIRSAAGLPLMVDDRVLGALFQYSLRPAAFTGRLPMLTALARQVALGIENVRLFQAEQRLSRRLALLADVARLVASSRDARVLLQSVAEDIRCHFAYPLVGIFTLDGEGHTLTLRGFSGVVDPPEWSAGGEYRQSIDRGIVGYVARTGKSHLVADVSQDPYYHPPRRVAIRSELCVPILDAGRVVGVVDVESDRLAAFDEEDRSLLEAVADTVGIGLRNVRLHEESGHRLQELTLLSRISVGFGATLDLDALVSDVLDGLRELVTADRTYFMTVDLDAYTWERTHEQCAPGVEPTVGLRGSFEDVPVELETLLAGEPFAISDVGADPRVEARQETYRRLGVRSTLLVPVLVRQGLYGVLGFEHCRQTHAWHPEEFRLVRGVARQLEMALENVYLFEEARLRADELAAALARLAELDRLKDEFIQNVSHELRSPVAIIRGYAEMLEAGELGELQPQHRKPIAVIARRARMVSDLVRDIMLILEAEISPPKPEPVQLGVLARTAVEDFQVAAEQANLTLYEEIPPNLPPVLGSYSYLRRVLDNLLDNAIKFTPSGGSVTVQVRPDGEGVALDVIDTGIGIPSSQLEHIFDRFYQVDGSAWRQYGGVGLGLALVREIVRTYGGRVTVESQVGQGSTFTVVLPVAANVGGGHA